MKISRLPKASTKHRGWGGVVVTPSKVALGRQTITKAKPFKFITTTYKIAVKKEVGCFLSSCLTRCYYPKIMLEQAHLLNVSISWKCFVERS